MILSVIIGLIAWSITSTFFLFKSIRQSDKRHYFHRKAQRELRKLPSEKQFDAFLSAHEATEKSIPWFQRSLSTLGVVAFFSMSAAALTQTISAQLSEFKASAAERRFSYVQDNSKITEVANSRSSRAILAMIASGIPQMPEMTEFLQSRLESLTDPRRPTDTTIGDVQESVAIAIGLKKTQCAAQIWRSHPELELDSLELRAADLLAFSKLFLFLGDHEKSGIALSKIPETTSTAFAEDVAAVRYVLSKNDASVLARSAQEISEQFHKPRADVKDNIIGYVRALNSVNAQLSSTRQLDFCRPARQ